ncbi:conserved hypothetical protein [Xenorhabdus nematophila F1]|uniref:Uncharacterized protein n=1 Tax=Xenorhabdus nematophila (strain ATCC 19061 / DSM 3370 / CCUG 14189 / LMG 1036 / NCIMB 9965 / AN6) TaxID=406817 RepID=D3VC40_XENNA|nr:hypothetical protein XNC1_1630 [Xenorhabdus nematophila ATCC 19061]CCW29943.1 conserved hypothetical protein [Xenorhabdus nematophila F1]
MLLLLMLLIKQIIQLPLYKRGLLHMIYTVNIDDSLPSIHSSD